MLQTFCDIANATIACSRLSVVRDEQKQVGKNEGELRQGADSLPNTKTTKSLEQANATSSVYVH